MSSKRYLLDTNVFLHLGNQYPGWLNIVQKLEQINPINVFVSVGTVFEISRMVERAKMKKAVLKTAVETLEMFQVISLDTQKSALGGSVHAWYMNRGVHVSDVDALIVSTAISEKLVVVTDDAKMHKFSSVTFENWVRESES